MKRFLLIVTAVASMTGAACAGSQTVVMEGAAPFSSGAYRVLATNVSFGDLDVSTPAGAAALYGRLEAASHAVCAEKFAVHVSGDLAKQYAICRSQAVREAVAKINIPRLTDVASSR
jgi:hypothetical protein